MISTTKEQSARLLKCGVPADNADMSWHGNTLETFSQLTYDMWLLTPAWSLNALLGLLPKEIDIDGYPYRISIYFEDPDESVIGNQWCVFYKPKRHDEKGSIDDVPMYAKDLIECAVLMIEWLSANGHKLNVGE